jgi:hypothetical protein
MPGIAILVELSVVGNTPSLHFRPPNAQYMCKPDRKANIKININEANNMIMLLYLNAKIF